jgi:hypothetical protein
VCGRAALGSEHAGLLFSVGVPTPIDAVSPRLTIVGLGQFVAPNPRDWRRRCTHEMHRSNDMAIVRTTIVDVCECRSWRNRRVPAPSAFSRFPPVHRADLEGQQRVDLTHSAHPRQRPVFAQSDGWCRRNLAVPSKSRNFRFGSNRRVQSAFRERSVLAPLSHSVYDRFFWPGGTGGVGLSGHRGEIGNHKVAGKIGVTTMAALPRNHENAVKSRTWRHFSLPCTLQRSARRTREPVERVSSKASIFRTASTDCLPSRRRLKARCSV